ncbi:hypothetical protein SAMN05444156_3120 [Verrucomicrobium sp. GAS474]|uniref:hypothetical protein n=1 Tax=Verrucomicrobium sp. GAS474 TaxID=1882831 RepID=UPI00087C8F88|nr:hypothetical protein [Verrucomicrobium sp. GAS474]SDU29394.1 hypothetical protein SAMN05444156_3120 [Verrucomicrobium sp. GAS474]
MSFLETRRVPVPILVDTDLGSDCDDAGALAVLHALADAGEAEIAACLYSSGRNRYGPGCLAAINAYYGRPDVPIGTAAESDLGDPRNDFLEPIATNRALYGHGASERGEFPSLLTVYRRVLAALPDGSARIVSIGHTRGLHDLLFSGPDGESPLSGHELIRRKVDVWVAMGGSFPVEEKAGWNFGRNGAAAYSASLVEGWPTPIVFSGYEIGLPLRTGPGLRETPPGNPVRESYRLWENALETGRSSWDQTAILCAVRGAGEYWSLRRGRCRVDAGGRTQWGDAPDGPHAHLVPKMASESLCREIEELMCRPPRLRAGTTGPAR